MEEAEEKKRAFDLKEKQQQEAQADKRSSEDSRRRRQSVMKFQKAQQAKAKQEKEGQVRLEDLKRKEQEKEEAIQANLAKKKKEYFKEIAQRRHSYHAKTSNIKQLKEEEMQRKAKEIEQARKHKDAKAQIIIKKEKEQTLARRSSLIGSMGNAIGKLGNLLPGSRTPNGRSPALKCKTRPVEEEVRRNSAGALPFVI